MNANRIKTVDKAAIEAIITTGRPVGFWMAQTSQAPILWTGVAATGDMTTRYHGTFPEVLTWLQKTAGIGQEKPAVDAQNASRERAWSGTLAENGGMKSERIPIRIEGAEIQPWKELPGQVMGLDGTPVAGIDAVMLTRSRGRGGLAAQAQAQDEEILRLYGENKTYAEIAAEVGIVTSTVLSRMKEMRRRGVKIPDGRRERLAARISERDRKILALLNEGFTGTEAAEKIGESPNLVYDRVKIMRSAGIEVPDVQRARVKAETARREAAVLAAYAPGRTAIEIAKEVGECVDTVRRRIKKLRAEGRIS